MMTPRSTISIKSTAEQKQLSEVTIEKLISKVNFLTKKAAKQMHLYATESYTPSYIQLAIDDSKIKKQPNWISQLLSHLPQIPVYLHLTQTKTPQTVHLRRFRVSAVTSPLFVSRQLMDKIFSILDREL